MTKLFKERQKYILNEIRAGLSMANAKIDYQFI
jgi:hypothetical protein